MKKEYIKNKTTHFQWIESIIKSLSDMKRIYTSFFGQIFFLGEQKSCTIKILTYTGNIFGIHFSIFEECRLYILIKYNKEWITERAYKYIRDYEQIEYISCTESSCQTFSSEIFEVFLSVLNCFDTSQICSKDNYGNELFSSFGIFQAQRYNSEHKNPYKFLFLLEYYRQTYIDLILQAGAGYVTMYGQFITRSFGFIKSGFSMEWSILNKKEKTEETETLRGLILNKKSDWQYIIEKLKNPVILLNIEGKISLLNRSATNIFSEYVDMQNKESSLYSQLLSWMDKELFISEILYNSEFNFYKTINIKNKPCNFKITMFKISGNTNKIEDIAIIFYDITGISDIINTLQYTSSIENLITKIAIYFFNIDFSNFDMEIKNILRLTGEFVGVDRCFINIFSENLNTLKYLHEWGREGLTGKHREIEKTKLEYFPWFMGCIKKFEPFYIAKISDIPPEGEAEKKLYQISGVKSVLAIPLSRNEKLIGCLGFHNMVNEKIWKKEDIKVLKFLGSIFLNIFERFEIEKKLKIPPEIYGEAGRFHNIIGKSKEMQKIYRIIKKVANIQSTVLITGESGTGKELIAEALHYEGRRKEKLLVKVNCSTLSEHILESELFGHVKGAFTGAIKNTTGRFKKADGGTIFLDEIGDISATIQKKLLRVIQEKEFEAVGSSTPIKVDVRLVVATNRNLLAMVKEGNFREDLYYRLDVVKINLPPLRERKEDIPLLVEHFINKFNEKFNKKVLSVSEEVYKTFMDYLWPGNIRELEHALEHAVIFCDGSAITTRDLPSKFNNLSECALIIKNDRELHKLKKNTLEKAREAINRIEDDVMEIKNALKRTDGNKNEAAKLLGISRITLYRKMKKYKLHI